MTERACSHAKSHLPQLVTGDVGRHVVTTFLTYDDMCQLRVSCKSISKSLSKGLIVELFLKRWCWILGHFFQTSTTEVERMNQGIILFLQRECPCFWKQIMKRRPDCHGFLNDRQGFTFQNNLPEFDYFRLVWNQCFRSMEKPSSTHLCDLMERLTISPSKMSILVSQWNYRIGYCFPCSSRCQPCQQCGSWIPYGCFARDAVCSICLPTVMTRTCIRPVRHPVVVKRSKARRVVFEPDLCKMSS